MKEAKNYTASDIERYHKGQLSAADMHTLEKAALDDPFLADALEGYRFTQTPSADMATLQQKLQLRVEGEQKRRRVFFMDTTWMKVAALFIVIAGGGWLVARLFTNDKAETLAGNKQVQKAPGIVTTEAAQDSVTVYSDAPAVTQAPVTAQSPARQKEQELKQGIAAPPPNATALQKPEHDAVQIPPATFSTATADSLKEQVYAARERSFLEKKEDAFFNKATAAANEKPKSSAPAKADTIKNFNVTLKRDTTGLGEVVVVGYGAAKKRESTAGQARGIVMDTLEPASGWRYFDDYVASNLKEPEELKAKGVKGTVELSFEVNKEGEPVNIAVTKSLCEKCDEEAVRLLKEGPKWKRNKKKGKVKITF